MINEAKINWKSEAETFFLEPIVMGITFLGIFTGESDYYSNRIIARTGVYAEQDGRLPLVQRLFVMTLSPTARFDADRAERSGIEKYFQGAQNG